MKKVYILLFTILTGFLAPAQNPIPNPTFATAWSGGKPNGWTDSRDITQVSPGSDDNYAAEGLKSSTTYPAYSTSSGNTGFAITQQYGYLNLYYKFNSVSSDVMEIFVIMNNSSHSQVGSGVWQSSTSVSSFTFLSVPIYYSGSAPSECIIRVNINSSSSGVPTVGTYFIIDNLSLTVNPVSAIDENGLNAIKFSVSPNPASNWLAVELNRSDEAATLRLLDIAGRGIKTIPASESKTLLDISDVNDGIYLLAIEQKGAIATKKIVIAR